MSVKFLISTVDGNIAKNSKLTKFLRSRDHLIVNQGRGCSLEDGLNVLNSDKVGLSKSRNEALANVIDTDFCVVGDDDVSYKNDAEDIIRKAFSEKPDADVITFKVGIIDSKKDYKDYSKNGRPHNYRTILNVSSVEIVLRSNVLNGQVKFPEEMGLGTKIPCGEESVFLMNLLRRNYNLYYYPEVICFHPEESSGKVINSKQNLFARGYLFKKNFGGFGFFFIFAYWLKNLTKISLNNWHMLIKGFLKNPKKNIT